MKISELQECVELAKTLNFTKTAQRFYITQSVFSRHIANLEKEVGFAIFSRSPQGVQITERGQIFIEGAQNILREYDKMLREIGMDDAAPLFIDISYLVAASRPFLAKANQQFKSNNPDVHLRCHAFDLTGYASLFEDGTCDLMIVVDHVNLPSTFTSETLYWTPYVAVVPENHALFTREQLCLDDLVDQTLVLIAKDYGSEERHVIDGFLSSIDGRYQLGPEVHELHDLELALSEHDCIGLCMRVIENDFTFPARFIPVAGLDSGTNIIAAWRKDSPKEYLVREYVDIIRQTLSEG